MAGEGQGRVTQELRPRVARAPAQVGLPAEQVGRAVVARVGAPAGAVRGELTPEAAAVRGEAPMAAVGRSAIRPVKAPSEATNLAKENRRA